MRSLFICLIVLAFAAPVLAQTTDENEDRCADTGHPDQQIISCSALIESGTQPPDSLAVFYVNRGVVYNKKHLYDEALADANEAIALNANLSAAYGVRGSAYRFKGLNDQAIADYTKGLTYPDRPVVTSILHNDRAEAYENKHQYEQAIADFTEAIANRPDYAGVYNNRAWAYHLMGADARGLPDAEKAVAMKPADAGDIETRAEIYEKLGRTADAAADYSAALKLVPSMKEASDGLARLSAARH